MSEFENRYRTKHKAISLVKSAIRIVGCIAAALYLPDAVASITALGLGLVVAEVLGIAEEMI